MNQMVFDLANGFASATSANWVKNAIEIGWLSCQNDGIVGCADCRRRDTEAMAVLFNSVIICWLKCTPKCR